MQIIKIPIDSVTQYAMITSLDQQSPFGGIGAQTTNNWHSDTIARFKTLSIESLTYIRQDAAAAAEAGKGFNPKVGQYLDEVHYANMELKRRGIK